MSAVTREIDGGLETIGVKLPCVLTADLRLNEPRYATLPNIMVLWCLCIRPNGMCILQKAKKKPMEKKAPKDYGVDIAGQAQTTITQITEPPKRQAGDKVADVAALVDRLAKLGFVNK
jgi:electron transfer flavoprotein beta subunit